VVEQHVNAGLLRMSIWEDEIQLNRELPGLSGEMCVSQVG